MAFPNVKTILTAGASFILLATAGCGGGNSEESGVEATVEERDGALVIDGEEVANAELWKAAQEEGSLTLYSTLSEVLEDSMVQTFEQQTGLSVDIVRHNGSRLFELIESEHGAGQLQADVVRRSDIDLVREHAMSGVFKPHCPPAWDKLIQVKEPDCLYWASNETIYAIGYNSEMVDEAEAPKTWDDLLDPQWKGEVGLNNITGGGTTWSRDSWLRQEKGVEYWKRLAAQETHITTSAGTVADMNARGEIAVGMALVGTHGAAKEEGAPLEVVLPSDGIPSSAHWIGTTSGGSNPNAAKVFVNWNASLAGQTAVAKLTGDYPVRADAPAPEVAGTTLPDRSEIELVFTESVEPTEADRNREEWMREWLRIFNYTPEAE